MLGTVLNTLLRFVPPLLPRLITERPDLLVDHALAYAALAQREIEVAKRRWIRRIVASAIALASWLSFLMLSGVALMLYATTQQQAGVTGVAWMLWVVPGVMLLLAVISTFTALSSGISGTNGAAAHASLGAQVREQFRLDMQAFRLATEQHP